MLLDRPAAAMDEQSRFEGELIHELGAGTTVVLSTHPVAGVVAACTDVVVLRAGKLPFWGTPQGLRELGGSGAVGGERVDAGALERGYSAALHVARRRAV